MTEEKQIEEMAYEIETRLGYLKSTCYNAANVLYNEGYRKQSVGEWIAKPQEWYIGETEWMCSNCKEEFSPIDMVTEEFLQMMKFCPHCGAKMKGESK